MQSREVTDRVRALGALLPLDGRLSWIADGVEGSCAASLLPDRDRRRPDLLLDTGAPLHESSSASHSSIATSRPTRDLTLVLSRIVEFDSFGNAGTILEHYPVTRVYSQFSVLEWVYYRHVHDREPLQG